MPDIIIINTKNSMRMSREALKAVKQKKCFGRERASKTETEVKNESPSVKSLLYVYTAQWPIINLLENTDGGGTTTSIQTQHSDRNVIPERNGGRE